MYLVSDESISKATSSKQIKTHVSDDETITAKKKRRNIQLVYANVNFDRNAFLPWRVCRYHKRSITSNEIKNDALIEIHSDDEDNTVRTIPMDEINLNATSAATGGHCNADIVNLDSDEEDEINNYHIIESKDRTIGVMKVPAYSLATFEELDEDAELPERMRIIARRNGELLPYTKSLSSNEKYYLYSNDKNAFYAGIIGYSRYQQNNNWHYLVFFDDGHVQYVAQCNIRAVFHLPQLKHVHPNAKKFCEYYFNGPENEKVPEIVAQTGDTVSIHVNGSFESAIVLNTFVPVGCKEAQLFKVHCQKWNRFEWIYTGSPRLEKVWTYMTKAKGLWIFNPEADSSLVELSSDSEDEEDHTMPSIQPCPADQIADTYQISERLDPARIVRTYRPPLKYKKHVCNAECIKAGESDPIIFQYALLDRPLLSGWIRHTLNGRIEYTTPCGRSYKSINSITKYLISTNSTLAIDCFSVDKEVRCLYERTTQVPQGPGGIRALNDVSSFSD